MRSGRTVLTDGYRGGLAPCCDRHGGLCRMVAVEGPTGCHRPPPRNGTPSGSCRPRRPVLTSTSRRSSSDNMVGEEISEVDQTSATSPPLAHGGGATGHLVSPLHTDRGRRIRTSQRGGGLGGCTHRESQLEVATLAVTPGKHPGLYRSARSAARCPAHPSTSCTT